MSFSIESILRKDKILDKSNSGVETKVVNENRLVPSNESILHQTLTNRNSYTCYRSGYESDYSFFRNPYHYPQYYEQSGLPLYNPMHRKSSFCSYLHPLSPMMAHYSSEGSKRKGQVRFTTTQTDALEKYFACKKYLSTEDRQSLAPALNMTDRQVKTWFQNRRAKLRRSSSASCPEKSGKSNSESEDESQ